MATQQEFERQIAELTARVWRLENTLKQYGIEHADPGSVASPAGRELDLATSDAAAPLSTAVQPASVEQDFEPTPLPSFAKGQRPQRSLESRIGSQLFNRIGIVAVLVGMAWFLQFAIANHWIGPLGRVIIGLLAGTGFNLWSERFRSKGYAAFSYSLKAVGSGILYLSLWAAFSYFHLIPGSVAFLLMIAVTAWNGFMCWVQDSELLALYAIVGGFSTPLLLSTGENHELILFGYLLMLDVAVLAMIALKPWSRLLLSAYVGTVIFALGWYASYYNDVAFWLTACFITIFFLIFALAPRLLRALRDVGGATALSTQDNLVLVLLPLANAAFGFWCYYLILDTNALRWLHPWVAVGFASFYLLLLQLPTASGRKPAILSSLHLTLAVVFLTIAIPLEAHGRWITLGWLIEGVALLWAAQHLRLLLLRVLACGALILGFIALVVSDPYAAGPVLANARFATFLAGIAAFVIAAWLALHTTESSEATSPAFSSISDNLDWLYIAAASVLAVNILILLSIGYEIHAYWWSSWTPYGANAWMRDYSARRIDAQFTYSAWFMLFGAILLLIGFWRRSAFFRWQALILLAVSIGKVFLFDMHQLSEGYRIVSFLGLGALLLAVSFAYQRDWLNLRGNPANATGGAAK
jgi:uncharacterized membrane protein